MFFFSLTELFGFVVAYAPHKTQHNSLSPKKRSKRKRVYFNYQKIKKGK